MTINLDMQNVLVIKRMYDLRNVRLVAESMGKTSGAISKNLTKMKAQLDDPLFIQTKNGFEPTSFVEANMPHFEQILASADAIKPQEFSPPLYTGDVAIYANTLFWDRFGDKLYLELLKQAPHANYAFLRWGLMLAIASLTVRTPLLFITLMKIYLNPSHKRVGKRQSGILCTQRSSCQGLPIVGRLYLCFVQDAWLERS